ncbi:MAG: hypothetical protein JKX98_07660, partial [Alcanivoracaceae bacterium]|nr:hypothetical protein [Alcanivoracaceae bacterium]
MNVTLRLLLILTIFFITTVQAQGEDGNFCVKDFRSGAVCTANDVRIESLTVTSLIEDCNTGTIGETEVVFDTLVSAAGSPNRFDIGIFLAKDGGSARDGDLCHHNYLSGSLTATPFYGDVNGDMVSDLTNGPWWDGAGDGDTCGDIESNTQLIKTLPALRFQCTDSNLDGSVDISVCTSWDNNTGTACNVVSEAFPGTNSKCSCGSVELGIPPVYLTVTKSANTPVVFSGNSATFTITATSTGVENLTTVVLDDVQCDTVSGPTGDDGDSILSTTETWIWICTVDNVTNDFTNTATVTAVGETSMATVNQSDTANVIVINPAVSIVKTGVLDDGGDGLADIGDIINYTFLITNTGDTDLINLSVTDPLIVTITCPAGNPIASLTVGAFITCAGSYAITQIDLDAGQRDNTATVSGQDAVFSSPVNDTDTEMVNLPHPALNTVKALTGNADEDGSGSVSLNDTLTFTITVTNTGNVVLNNVTVTDSLITPS